MQSGFAMAIFAEENCGFGTWSDFTKCINGKQERTRPVSYKGGFFEIFFQ
jgi:hypothetical protein